jgi:hypothetical protein
MPHPGLALSCLALLFALPAGAQESVPAEDAPEPEVWSIHGQATYVRQTKPAFQAAYSGPASLSPLRERSYSFTSTAFLGLRVAPATEVYLNPELVQGLPMSNLTGLGGLTNGELQKTAGTTPTLYRARLFVRHTWGLGGGSERVESDLNQLAGLRDKRRVTLTAGNLAVSDLFDGNAHAHDARSQFFNWSLVDQGAYDFAADSRGYSWGAALEYVDGDWAVRAGRFLQPKESNGKPLDYRPLKRYGDQAEIEKAWAGAFGRDDLPGKARLLVFRNVATMGGFRDALDFAAANGTTPDVADVRERRSKVGWGVSLEQQLTEHIGGFTRFGRNDGRSETYAFAEIDRSMSAGFTWSGGQWGRAQDAWGVALSRNGLSRDHREYLAAGGCGFFICDGRLTYRPETIAETYYRFGFDLPRLRRSAISVGAQYIRNPAYNADRGPVKVGTVRLHTEF